MVVNMFASFTIGEVNYNGRHIIRVVLLFLERPLLIPPRPRGHSPSTADSV